MQCNVCSRRSSDNFSDNLSDMCSHSFADIYNGVTFSGISSDIYSQYVHGIARATDSKVAIWPVPGWHRKSRSGWHRESANLPWDEADRRRRRRKSHLTSGELTGKICLRHLGTNWSNSVYRLIEAAVLQPNSASMCQVHHWHTSSRPPPGCSQLTLLLISSALALQAHQVAEPVQLCSHFNEEWNWHGNGPGHGTAYWIFNGVAPSNHQNWMEFHRGQRNFLEGREARDVAPDPCIGEIESHFFHMVLRIPPTRMLVTIIKHHHNHEY